MFISTIKLIAVVVVGAFAVLVTYLGVSLSSVGDDGGVVGVLAAFALICFFLVYRSIMKCKSHRIAIIICVAMLAAGATLGFLDPQSPEEYAAQQRQSEIDAAARAKAKAAEAAAKAKEKVAKAPFKSEAFTMRGCLDGVKTIYGIKTIFKDKPKVVIGETKNGRAFSCRQKSTGTKGIYYELFVN